MQILVVEDDVLLSDGICQLLRASSHKVSCAKSAEIAADLLTKKTYDLMLLDISLPGMDGVKFLQQLRAGHNDILILMLTARNELNEKENALKLGADDYLSKPFANEELLARISVLSRRRDKTPANRLTHGSLILDIESHRTWLAGKQLILPKREWTLLKLLVENIERVVSKERIIRALCEWDYELNDNTVEVYISRLRAKVSAGGIRIHTIRSFGYMLEAWRE